MVKRKIFLYSILLVAIFFCLFFIMGQNQKFKEANGIEQKLYSRIKDELTAYHEALYQIEENKKSLSEKTDSPDPLKVGTTILNKSPLSTDAFHENRKE